MEKESLACTWAAEKFADYVLGKMFTMETDHKPLVSLLGNKNLDNLPPRILWFRLRLSRFTYSMQHVSGKMLYTADALSRNLDRTSVHQEADASTKDIDCFINAIVSALPTSNDRLAVYKTAQAKDPICQQVTQFCLEGWPDQRTWPKELHPYWGCRHKLTVVNNLLLYGSCIVVPLSMQAETIRKIHAGHLGLQKCLLHAKTSV